MKIFIQAIDYNIWKTIIKGSHKSIIMINGIATPKLEDDWDEQDIKLVELNAIAMNLLYYALDSNEFNRIFIYSSAKEIWDILEIIHEDTNQVKGSKITMLVHKYELFKIKLNETITSMYTRFTNIMNNVKNLGKSYTDFELSKIIFHFLS